MKSKLRTVILVLIILAGGVGGYTALKATRPTPPEKPTEEVRRLVRVTEARKQDFQVSVQESGNVEPKTVLEVTAEVAGRATYVADNLRIGYFVSKGELLIEIDPREYRLEITRNEAEIAQLKAEMAKIAQRRENIRRNLDVEKRKLKLARSELERKRSLLESQSLSQSEVDRQEIEFKQVEAAMLNQKNALSLLKSEQELIRARIEATEARLELAKIKLEKTEVRAPFDGRVLEESIEPDQYIQKGQKLARLYDISSMEIVVNLSPVSLRNLMRRQKGKLKVPIVGDLEKANEMIRERGAEATVSFKVGDEPIRQWSGRVTRFKAGLDESTRTLPVVVEVKDPFSGTEPGVSPPLVPGMYVTVKLEGPVLKDVFKVPRSAIHEKKVYLANDGKLEIRDVELDLVTREYAIVAKGLQDGDRIITSQISIPIPGMLVRTVEEAPTDAGETPVASRSL